MRAGVSPEAQNSQGRKERERESEQEREQREREESRVKAEVVRIPAQSTLEETDYEKQWGAKRA